MLTPHPLVVAAVVGALAGTHASIWGMYKDSIYEGFGAGRFARSMIVGTVAGILLQLVLRLELPEPASLIMLFGLAYAVERGIVEVWKTFLRNSDRSKVFLPMPFGIGNVNLASRGARMAGGIGYVVAVAAILLALAQLDRDAAGPLTLAKSAFVGLVGGAIIAASAMWKDAQKEGFQILEFSDSCGEWHTLKEETAAPLRSLTVTFAFAVALSSFTDSYLHLAAASIGYERAAVETYRTFFAREIAPGKFTGKPELHPEMRVLRHRAVPVLVGILALVVLTVALAAFA